MALTAETRTERVTVDFPGQDKRAIFELNRIAIETADGTLTEARDNPEESFEGQQRETPWNDIHVVYFAGEAASEKRFSPGARGGNSLDTRTGTA